MIRSPNRDSKSGGKNRAATTSSSSSSKPEEKSINSIQMPPEMTSLGTVDFQRNEADEKVKTIETVEHLQQRDDTTSTTSTTTTKRRQTFKSEPRR
jgi:hypothetical protein